MSCTPHVPGWLAPAPEQQPQPSSNPLAPPRPTPQALPSVTATSSPAPPGTGGNATPAYGSFPGSRTSCAWPTTPCTPGGRAASNPAATSPTPPAPPPPADPQPSCSPQRPLSLRSPGARDPAAPTLRTPTAAVGRTCSRAAHSERTQPPCRGAPSSTWGALHCARSATAAATTQHRYSSSRSTACGDTGAKSRGNLPQIPGAPTIGGEPGQSGISSSPVARTTTPPLRPGY